MLPLGILGTMVGVIAHTILPDFIIEMLFTIFLLYVTYKMVMKARSTYQKETQKFKEIKSKVDLLVEERSMQISQRSSFVDDPDAEE